MSDHSTERPSSGRARALLRAAAAVVLAAAALVVRQGQRMMDATTTSASALPGVIPAAVFFLVFQRTLTRGITAGAIR